jgi:hypothetical protein
MSDTKQLTIAELILRLGSGVFGVSGLGILGIGCVYLINDTTGMCIGFLENIPKMLTYSDDITKETNKLTGSAKIYDDNNANSINTIITRNNFTTKYYLYLSTWGLNYLRRGLVIGGMIGGGVGMRFLGTWIGSPQVINSFNGRFGSNYI